MNPISIGRNISASKVFRLIHWIIRQKILNQENCVVNVQGFKMCLDLRVPGISRTLAIHGIREADHTEIFRRELEPGMVVVDIGANIGYYALIAARAVGHTGKVYCLEPDPRNISLLQKNVQLNSLGEIVEIHQIAASNRAGEATMFQAMASNLNTLVDRSHLKSSGTGKLTGTEVPVPTTTIDQFLESRGGMVNFIRMDIEGYEVEALTGMMQTLQNSPPPCKILLETHPQMYTDERNFAGVLDRLLQLSFVPKGLVSAGEPTPAPFAKRGYKPTQIFRDGAFQRGYYEKVTNQDVVSLTTRMPKVVRYLLLIKED